MLLRSFEFFKIMFMLYVILYGVPASQPPLPASKPPLPASQATDHAYSTFGVTRYHYAVILTEQLEIFRAVFK